jgi:hypothetical protein
MSNTDLALLGQLVLGYVMQWARSFKNVPNWATWAVFVAASIAVYVWITPTVVTDFTGNWRTAVAACVSFILATRGVAATTKEVKAAPPTNSL